ncbi:MAG: hypothetical protein CMI03_04790 [Oceanospirillaceae bacterium]|uniref:ankyrin repeat domain-containing protein n=1 Tax=unclassified Thalassolituus TaxID=2624967 RepID=UPI000C452FF6|nr:MULTISPECIES: ankyrin repeat domain-containing protein [unclassified Thalassolituus]MAS26129.1 hypothetical protein [Oceanospirillaceae bacterium]MBL34045.1 hypothetical protein [Oceanospirillaceae bacterium]MBS52050.1 hypothetical protein [Oceanospirillaceae bacterium]|tara:strand:+ start:98 stop:877 length:780 start_codon:yes stop_codon:yes gene_type:complete
MIKWHNISVSEAEEMLYDSHMLVLDMRDFRSYLADHHPRALHLTSDNLRAILKHTARSVPVLIYCYHGHRSQDMAQLFSDFGFTSCYSLDGGYEAWCPDIRHPDNELSKELRQWMLEHNFMLANLDERGDNNETALMHACRAGLYPFARELVLAGAGIDLVNKDGNNALWMACQSGNEDIVNLLLNNDIDMDQQNDHGATALIYTASAGNLALTAMLIEAGADTTLTTLDDFSALDVAANAKTLRMLQYCMMPDQRYVA